MSQVITVRINFEVNTTNAERKMQRAWLQAITVQQALTRSLQLLRRLGLPEDMDRAAGVVLRLIAVMNTARLTAIALNAALAGTPGGWLLLGLSAIGLALDVGDLMMSA